jgi:3'(2'), 5'-bisphosphate nucleotidase
MASLRRCDTPQPLDLPRLRLPRLNKHRRKELSALIPGAEIRTDEGLLDALTSIVSAAAAAILAARVRPLEARRKADLSPVTAADHAAEAVILQGLARVLPHLPVVSEEAATERLPKTHSDCFILVDPLDGTRELLDGRDEFTVNVAVVSGGDPRIGIVAAPAHGLIWRGRVGDGAERLRLVPGAPASEAQQRTAIHARPCPRDGLVAAVSRSHRDSATDALLARLPVVERLICGSALKFCRLAEGAADVYPRLSTTCEWDIAAGHALLAAAGGSVTTPEGAPLRYGRVAAGFKIPSFVAWGDPVAPALVGLRQ